MKIRNIILTGLLILFTACSEDFLYRPSQADLTTGIYFSTQADFEKAVNGIYAPLRGFFAVGSVLGMQGVGPLFMIGDMHSDNARYYYNPNYRAVVEAPADFIPEPDMFSSYWNNFYSWIARANEVLSRIDGDIKWDNQQIHDNLKGQALFLRAWSYWWLARLYGDVCIHTEPVSTIDQASAPLSPRAEVINLIKSDASDAAELLPNKANQAPGRVTSGTAKMLLAEVLIWEKDYKTAETLLKSLESEYQLMQNYADCFDPNYKNNAESIFEIQYSSAESQYASNFAYSMFPWPMARDTVAKLTGVSNPMSLTAGQGGCIPSPNLLAQYEPGDLRFNATIRNIYSANGALVPTCVKYLHTHSLLGQANENLPIYRYAEALLYLAEAINEQDDGRQSVAMSYVNQVRARADLPPVTTASTLQEVRDAILKERRIELAFEGKRFWDLVRFNMLESVITAYGNAVKADPVGHYLAPGITLPPTAFTDFRTKFAIPDDERLYNSKID